MADETAKAAKRALEEDQTPAEDAPVGKKQKTDAVEAPAAAEAAAAAAGGDAEQAPAAEEAAGQEDAAAGAEGDEEAADAEQGEEDAAMEEDAAGNGTDAAAAAAAAAGGPVKLGYRTFNNSKEAADYLHDVLKKATPHRKLNEYESVMLLDLLQLGHPNAEQKLSGGVRAFVVAERRVEGNTTSCFHIKRLDNTLEDFSYRKCLTTLFPDYVMMSPQDHRGDGRGRGRGGRGGRGGGGRFGGRGRGGGGRGGRGGGRGRGGN